MFFKEQGFLTPEQVSVHSLHDCSSVGATDIARPGFLLVEELAVWPGYYTMPGVLHALGAITSQPVLGSLHHQYCRI